MGIAVVSSVRPSLFALGKGRRSSHFPEYRRESSVTWIIARNTKENDANATDESRRMSFVKYFLSIYEVHKKREIQTEDRCETCNHVHALYINNPCTCLCRDWVCVR